MHKKFAIIWNIYFQRKCHWCTYLEHATPHISHMSYEMESSQRAGTVETGINQNEQLHETFEQARLHWILVRLYRGLKFNSIQCKCQSIAGYYGSVSLWSSNLHSELLVNVDVQFILFSLLVTFIFHLCASIKFISIPVPWGTVCLIAYTLWYWEGRQLCPEQ